MNGPQTKPLQKPRAIKEKNHTDLDSDKGNPADVHTNFVFQNEFRGEGNLDTVMIPLTRLCSYEMFNSSSTDLR